MCQLLGMCGNQPTDIVFSFSGFATRSAEHADGFGIAFFEGRGLRHFVDHLPAAESPVADFGAGAGAGRAAACGRAAGRLGASWLKSSPPPWLPPP